MAQGDVIISGAFTLDSAGRASIDDFISGKSMSGGHVIVLPDANSGKLWIGTVEGGA